MTISLRSRALPLSAAVAALALAFVALPASPLAPAPSAAADNPACITPIADYPNVHPQNYGVPWGFYGVDTEVGAYIAGDWSVLPGAAEAEGLLVVGGDATFNSGAYFNLGTVGLGSQVSAPAGSDMLTAGGNVTVGTTTTLDVGNHRGGNIRAGGTITPVPPSVAYEFNGGSAIPGAAGVLTPSASVPVYYQALSTGFAALATTGTVDLLTDPSEVRLIGDGTSTRQVFSIPGTSLGTIASPKAFAFSSIPANAVIVINVTGSVAEMGAYSYAMNGALLDFEAAEPDRVFSGWTQSIAWNFPTATDVTLGINAQLPGSVLIPTTGSTLDLRTSINGRLYVNGDVSFGGAGTSGLEIHNYPLRSTCALADGSFTVTKSVSDPDGVTDPDRVYTGTYECLDSLGAVVDDGSFSLENGETATVSGLPAGTECTATEDAATLTATPSATDPSYTWSSPTYSATSVTVVASSSVGITVTNTVLRGLGSIAVDKVLADPDSVVDPTRVFTGTISCTVGTPSPNTWSVTAAGAPFVFSGIPAGSVCTLAEDAPAAAPSSTDPSYVWEAPAFLTPNVMTVAAGSSVTIVVLNEVRRGLGDFEMVKVLDDPYDVVDASRIYTGTWSCTFNATVIESGTWSTTAGAAPLSLATDLPVGTVCTLAEDASTLVAPPLAGFPQYIWETPVIAPATVSILNGVLHRITVTNIVYDPITELAHAGTDSTGWMLVGTGVAAGGILLVFFARRRRSA